MSSSGPDLDIGSGSESGILSGAVSFFSKGGGIITLIMGGLGAIWLQGVQGVQGLLRAGFGFFVTGIDTVANVAAGLFGAIVGGPIPFLDFTAIQTGPLLVRQFGFLAWLAALAIALIGFRAISWYLFERDTSDAFIGSFTDLPFIGTDEEGETDNQ